MDNLETSYYGVYIPPEYLKQTDADHCDSVFPRIHVYTDKNEALKLVKKFKKARFKVFRTCTEAENFALNGLEQTNNVSTTEYETKNVILTEKLTMFRGPTPQDLVKLRKFIENGDIEMVKETIWDNPRYLISSGDTPSILKEGHRYNALHIATKAMNANMCQLILETVSCVEFVQLLYGEDNFEICQERAKIFLDLYLNTPDRGLNETPLHFAVKYGALECVEVLTSYTECDKNLKNKHGQYPKEIICQRCTTVDPVLRDKISILLEERYYVPVFRSEDGVTMPEIGYPFTPSSPPKLNKDPISPRVEIRAYAGPMKMKEAVEFRKKWKTPPRMKNSPRIQSPNGGPPYSPLNSFRLYDTEKGLERIGRELAHEKKVGWKEYWPFLETFVDLCTKEGLTILEEYIGKRYTFYQIFFESDSRNNSNSFKLLNDVNETYAYESDTEADVTPITDLCRAFKTCTISSGDKNSAHHHKINRAPSNSHNEIMANNPNVSPFLCVEKSLNVFGTRIFNLLTKSLDRLKIEIRHLISLILSYKSDERFSEVDFQFAHCKIASVIREKIEEEQDNFDLNYLNEFLCAIGENQNGFDHNLNDSPDHKNELLLNQHIHCIIQNVLRQLQNLNNSSTVHSNYNSEAECRKNWTARNKCQCSWEGSTFKRNLERWDSYRRRHNIRSVSKSLSFDSSVTNEHHYRNQKLDALPPEIVMNGFPQEYVPLDNRATDIVNERNLQKPTKNVQKVPKSLSCYLYSSNETSFNSYKNNNEIKNLFFDEEEVLTDDSSTSDDEDNNEDMFYTPPSSPALSDASDELLDCSDEGMIDVFLEGSGPTKTDADVYNAIKNVSILPTDYPNIYRWKHTIQLYPEEERERWPNVSTKNTHTQNTIINSTQRIFDTTMSPSWTRITGVQNSPLNNNRCSTPISSKRLWKEKRIFSIKMNESN